MQSTPHPVRRFYQRSEPRPARSTPFMADPYDPRKRLTIKGGRAVLLATLCSFGPLSVGTVYAQMSGPISQTVAIGSVAGDASIGPDVAVGSLFGVSSYGSEGGVSAFSLGFVVCNLGDEPVNYVADTNEHPVK